MNSLRWKGLPRIYVIKTGTASNARRLAVWWARWSIQLLLKSLTHFGSNPLPMYSDCVFFDLHTFYWCSLAFFCNFWWCLSWHFSEAYLIFPALEWVGKITKIIKLTFDGHFAQLHFLYELSQWLSLDYHDFIFKHRILTLDFKSSNPCSCNQAHSSHRWKAGGRFLASTFCEELFWMGLVSLKWCFSISKSHMISGKERLTTASTMASFNW